MSGTKVEKTTKSRVWALLHEAHRDKNQGTNRGFLTGLFVVFVLPFVAFFTASMGFDFGFWTSLLAGLLVPLATLAALVVLWMRDDERRGQVYAERFRDAFAEDDDSFDEAKSLLREAKTSSGVEKDMLTALDDVTFSPKPKLLGEFDANLQTKVEAPAGTEKPMKSSAPTQDEPSGDYLPLDPIVADDKTTEGCAELMTRAERVAFIHKMAADYASRDSSSFPLAEPWREQAAAEIYADHESKSPEQWAARWAHSVGTSDFGDYRYRNQELSDWIHRLHEIFLTPGEVERCRALHLTPEQIAKIDREEGLI